MVASGDIPHLHMCALIKNEKPLRLQSSLKVEFSDEFGLNPDFTSFISLFIANVNDSEFYSDMYFAVRVECFSHNSMP